MTGKIFLRKLILFIVYLCDGHFHAEYIFDTYEYVRIYSYSIGAVGEERSAIDTVWLFLIPCW